MGRHEKLVARFEKIPAAFTWDELCQLLSGCGFDVLSGAGSRFKFTHAERKRVISLHRPHPVNIVNKYALRQVYEVLRQDGLIK
ncbi:type II toxin-antitoxin system HicA family toxin [Pontiella sulfatireligans]|uniref:HicA protein n=1 Tax=Pontiella sulfatireligans TaxID=2750658 RepID=A0A6C2UL25_9BACT|nr:hypothetical protein SCARR_03009 [Pontiella sulfatireligans]